MKIIHTGDLHIGSAHGNLPPEKSAQRKREILDGFCQLARFAKENGVSAVLIAGDFFDENGVAAEWKRDALAAVRAASPVRFFYVSGNHDVGLELGADLPENLFLFSQNHGWYSYDLGENITLTGADSRHFDTALAFPPRLARERYNIVVLHGELREILPAMQNRNVDYLALGHIHKPHREAQRLDARGVYRYCGCFEGRGFDEVGSRGFFLLQIEKGKLTDEKFLSLAKRTVWELPVDITACQTYTDVETAAFSATAQIKNTDIVKLVLTGSPSAGLRKDLPLLSARIAERFFHAKVVDESRPKLDYRAFEKDLTERGEFVREVGRYEMNEAFRAEVLDVGLKALNGEEIDL